jgi:dienelactone hydrolase
MKMLQIIIAVFLCFGGVVNAQYNIGHTTINFVDPDRGNRVIETEIYYPAATTGEDVPVTGGSHPVIVFGHGFVMIYSAYQNIWEHLVPQGYIMMFPRTEGNISPNHSDFGQDLRFLVGEMQDEGQDNASLFYQSVDVKTAIMGHSMGGGASFLAAANNHLIETVIGLAPAETNPSSIDSAVDVTVPTLIMSGEQDGVTPPVDHHIPTYNMTSASCKTFINIKGGAHCYFANSNFNCDFGEGTSSSGISISRQDQHEVLFDFVELWLGYYLKDDCEQMSTFQDSLQSSNRITNQTTCPNVAATVPTIVDNAGALESSITGTNYQWYVDGNLISGATGMTHIPIQNGDYTVMVTNQYGCSKTSGIFTVSTGGVGINEQIDWQIEVYPNPANNLVRIKSDIDVNVSVYDYSGREIWQGARLRNKQINVETWSPGTYIIELRHDHNRTHKKLIVQ